MSTTLENCMIELARQLGDYWASTTTSGGSSTTVVDTELQAKASAWITDEAYDRITSGTYDEEERKISSLATSTLTTLAHGGTIATAVTYEVHRLFTASEKRTALVWAARNAFPHIFKQVEDDTKSIQNWLRNPSFEKWTSSSYPDHWRVDTVTATEQTAAPYVRFGASSCKLDTAAGYMYTTDTLVPDFLALAGQNVTFTKHGWCDTASALRLAIYDGTTTTYSDYHSGNSAWTEDDEPLEVEATIADTPTSVEFRTYLDEAAATAYVEDARAIGPRRHKYYIGDLGLQNDLPHAVEVERSQYSEREPWRLLRGWRVDKDGFLLLPSALSDRRLRIRGIGYLDFLSSGASSTAWDATIAIDKPQTDILVAMAAQYLCDQMILPTADTATSERWEKARAYWEARYFKAVGKFGMRSPNATVNW